MASGAAADQIIDEARRTTTSRRQLLRDDQFADISPDVGEIDEQALQERFEADPDAVLGLLATMTSATDVELRGLAKRLAAQLFLDLARTRPTGGRGIGRLATTRYRPDGDIDLDASFDALVDSHASGEAVDPERLRVQRWATPTTAWCLLVDRSGSMHGEPVATAAMAAAAVVLRAEGEYAVLSFGREVVACAAMWEHRDPDDVIDRVLALRGHGTTDVAAALRAAHGQLLASGAQRRVAILLSDCRATEPGDVAGAARALDELVVIAPDGDHVEAAALAESVGARWTTVTGPSSIAAAIDRVVNAR